MLIIVGALITTAMALRIFGVRMPGHAHAAQLGWMSEQWLAEHRAAQP